MDIGTPEFGLGQALLTLEKPLKLKQSRTSLRIGIPREMAEGERRVALTPGGVATLVASGHEVFVEEGAGKLAHFSDTQYSEVGAQIIDSAPELYRTSELIVKVAPPTEEELDLLREKQTLISALHLGSIRADFLEALIRKRIIGIAFEFMRDPDGTYPIVRMMHEISGSMAVQIAARYLESNEGGKGIVLGGISGIPPATVVILGAGVVGEWAARTALGFGAHVIVLDTDLAALRSLEHYLDRRVTTAMASPQYIQQAVKSADVLIGAKMGIDQRAPMLVTEDMVQEMRPGSVIVDVVIDQGGCIETSRPTTHAAPTYVKHGVIHYCVPNMPSNAARTATYALTNALVPYLLDIGDSGNIYEALWRNAGLRSGTYVYRSYVTKKNLANLFRLPYRDIDLLIASGI